MRADEPAPPSVPADAAPADSRGARRVRLIVLVLVLVTGALYFPVGHYDFVHYDDPGYVTGNLPVLRGLSWSGLRWAFTTGHESNWHPLTWLSHMLDCQLFGRQPGPAHLVNLLFHTLNAVLLFLLLRWLTGSLWRSALVAALFAWHPLQVQSVAWISERKNVLSTLFWLLAVWQYARWAQRPTRGSYALLVLLFALGLMSKPMLVTLPCVLLLLDFWPLNRWPREAFASSAAFRATAGKLVWEKWPLFLLAALSCAVTFLVQRAGGAVSRLEYFPLGERFTNALVSYIWYVGKTCWPADLCVFYPLAPQPGWLVGGAFVLLAAISFLAFRLAWRQPWLFVGWFLFLGTLVPVIGIVQVGIQARADRYMYLPAIGLFLLAAWGIDTWLPALRRYRGATAVAAGVLLCGALAATALQLPHWHDGESVMKRALAVTRNNLVAHNVLGILYQERGRLDESGHHFAEALRIDPRCLPSLNGMSYVLIAQRKDAEALKFALAALQVDPQSVDAHINLGWSLARFGKTNDALIHCQAALKLAPDNPKALHNLGITLSALNLPEQAALCHRQETALDPSNAEAHYLLGNALARLGQSGEAAQCYQRAAQLERTNANALVEFGLKLAGLGAPDAALECYRQALAVQPNHPGAHYDLANLLARSGQKEASLAHYAAVLQIKPDHVRARQNFGIALGDLGRFDEAATQFEAALQLKPDYPEAQAACGFALVKTGRFAEAAAHYAEALRLRPDWVPILDQWARLRATHPSGQLRNGQEAVRLAERARQLTGDPSAARLDTLAAAYAEAGRFDQAVATARQALQLAGDGRQTQLATQLQERLRLYEAGQPYREQP